MDIKLPEDVRITVEICDADAGTAMSKCVDYRRTPLGMMYIFENKVDGSTFGVRSGDERVYTESDKIRKL